MNFTSIKISFFACVLTVLSACSDPSMPDAVPSTEASTLTSKFLFVNTSPDAPSLNLYVNNLVAGTSVSAGNAQTGYYSAPLVSNNTFANTNIRAKAATGSIGGILGTADLILRATNTSTNNFQAANNASYTIFAIDSINRPKPIRTLNSANFADVTYYSSKDKFVAKAKLDPGQDTTIQLSIGSNNSTVAANLLKKYNGGALPPFFFSIGTVPLGSSDPGGVRFLLLPDVFPAAVADKSAIRFIHASPNTPAVWVRLNPSAGTPVVIASSATFVMGSSFSPSVGSRLVTSGVAPSVFSLYTTASSGVAIDYTLEVSTKADFSAIILSIPGETFESGKVYSVYLSGLLAGTGSKALSAGIVQHN